MTDTLELIKEIERFRKETGRYPDKLKIREDIFDAMAKELPRWVQDSDPTKKMSEKYTHFQGVKFEIIENEQNKIVPKWAIITQL